MTYEAVPDVPGLSVRLAPNSDGRTVITGIKLERTAVTAEALRAIPIARIEQRANRGAASADLPPLRREAAGSPEEFLRIVAAHYRFWACSVPNPVAAMAKAANVKPPTVHTWVREARLRGLLPAARRTKS